MLIQLGSHELKDIQEARHFQEPGTPGVALIPVPGTSQPSAVCRIQEREQ